MGHGHVFPAVHIFEALEGQLLWVAQVGAGQRTPGEEVGLVIRSGRERTALAWFYYVCDAGVLGPPSLFLLLPTLPGH